VPNEPKKEKKKGGRALGGGKKALVTKLINKAGVTRSHSEGSAGKAEKWRRKWAAEGDGRMHPVQNEKEKGEGRQSTSRGVGPELGSGRAARSALRGGGEGGGDRTKLANVEKGGVSCGFAVEERGSVGIDGLIVGDAQARDEKDAKKKKRVGRGGMFSSLAKGARSGTNNSDTFASTHSWWGRTRCQKDNQCGNRPCRGGRGEAR